MRAIECERLMRRGDRDAARLTMRGDQTGGETLAGDVESGERLVEQP